MKKILLWASALLIGTGFMSCTKSNDTQLFYSYGTVMERDASIDGGALRIRKDGGNFLNVRGWTSNLQTSDRVVVLYEIIGERVENGDNNIRLWTRPFWILTKNPLLWSNLEDNAADNAALGNDGFVAVDPWFGGLYLNVNFRMLFARNSPRAHLLNIVADDVAFDGQTITLTLRHNARGHVPGGGFPLRARNGIVSFNLVNLFTGLGIENYSEYPNIVLEWEEFINASRNETETKTMNLGKFTPWTVDRNPGSEDADRTEVDIE